MSESPKWCDFGPEMNHVLNRIGGYCREHGVAPDTAIRMFHCGIAAHYQLLGEPGEIAPPTTEAAIRELQRTGDIAD